MKATGLSGGELSMKPTHTSIVRAALAGALALAVAMVMAGGAAAQAPIHTPVAAPAADPAAVAELNSDELGMLELINAYRQSLGLHALRVSTALQEAARWKVGALAATGESKLSHEDLERAWRQRLLDFGY